MLMCQSKPKLHDLKEHLKGDAILVQ